MRDTLRFLMLFATVVCLSAVALADEGDAIDAIDDADLGPSYVKIDSGIAYAGYTLPAGYSGTDVYTSAFFVMTVLFENFPDARQYQVFQFVGETPVQKFTVNPADVDAVYFGNLPAKTFWSRVDTELLPTTTDTPSSGGFLAVLGTVFLVGFLIFVGVVGLVIFLIVKAQRGKK